MEDDIDNHHHTPRLTRASNIGSSADDVNTGQAQVLSNGAKSQSVDSLDDQPKNKLLSKFHRKAYENKP